MGRPPAVAGGRDTRVTIRLSEQETVALDALRGGMSRSDWFRSKIAEPMRQAPNTFTPPVEPVSATPAPTNAQTVPTMRTTPSTIETIPEDRHLFRRGELIGVRHVNGMSIRSYLCTCGCGEVREDRRA